MTDPDEHCRPQTPLGGDEATTLLGFLDYQRATLAWKGRGVDAEGMRATVGRSSMTLGRSQRIVDTALADGGLDQPGARTWPDGSSPSIRWILVHLIEEYARHNGHANLLREAVDGATGE